VLILELQASRIGLGLSAGCYLAALSALCYTAAPPLLIIAMALMTALGLGREWRRWGPRSGRLPAVVRLGHQECVLQYPDREVRTHPPVIQYLSEFLMVLIFKPVDPVRRWPGNAVRLVLYPDSLSASQHRRLRRYLRFDCRT